MTEARFDSTLLEVGSLSEPLDAGMMDPARRGNGGYHVRAPQLACVLQESHRFFDGSA
jgi:hypothetical protein